MGALHELRETPPEVISDEKRVHLITHTHFWGEKKKPTQQQQLY